MLETYLSLYGFLHSRYLCGTYVTRLNHPYSKVSDLTKHRVTIPAGGRKSCSCELCPKTFSLNSSLKVHVRVHIGEKPYSCHLCPMRFSENGNLTKHLRVHTGEKRFSCEQCPKTFALKSNMKLIYERTPGTNLIRVSCVRGRFP